MGVENGGCGLFGLLWAFFAGVGFGWFLGGVMRKLSKVFCV